MKRILSMLLLMFFLLMIAGVGSFSSPLKRSIEINSGWLYNDGTTHLGGGIDFDVANGDGEGGEDDIIAAASGKVIHVTKDIANGDEIAGGYGNYIIIQHDDNYTTRYAHLYYGSIQVKVGDYVWRGQELAKGGNTGDSTGPHLHFETRRNGVSVDPYDIN